MIAGAIPAPEGDIDSGVAWHYGDPLGEQRALVAGEGVVDLSHYGVATVVGPDRLTWLHALTSAHLESMLPGTSALALILSPHGHVEHELHVVDDGFCTWIITQPGTAASLVQYLESMKFMSRVEIADRSDAFGVIFEPTDLIDPEGPTWHVPADFAGTGHVAAGSDKGGDASRYVPQRPASFVGREVIIPRSRVDERVAVKPVGTWAFNAVRTSAAVPRFGFETDHRTLPHEVGWIGPGVHLAKGCYRGQETVARVHNLGAPPRRLALLHLDGSAELLPAHGDAVQFDGKDVGWIASAARHFEFGPIATAVLKRTVPTEAPLSVVCADGVVAATQEPVVVAP